VGAGERQNAEMGEQMSNELADSQFEYLLNAMEDAAQSASPTLNRYDEKRKAVLDYVAALRSEPPGLRYKATVIWDDKTTVHEGVYPDRQEPGLSARDEGLEAAALLKCVQTNLEKGMPKSIQRLQAKEIDAYLARRQG
jgi:hypothetical protein